MARFYEEYNSSVHRGRYLLAEKATAAYEAAREKTCQFLNAASAREIVFTSGTTESINLVAQTWGRKNVAAGDEVVVTAMEHHANLGPWQMLWQEKGAKPMVLPSNRWVAPGTISSRFSARSIRSIDGA